MHWAQNSIVFIGSWILLAVSAVWAFREGGYEPWVAAIAGLVGIAANKHLLPDLGSRKRTLTPQQKISARDKWRPIFEDYFLEQGRKNSRSDAIIHDIDRLDKYPTIEEGKGISSWFRIGLMGTYHRGVLLGLGWTYIKEEGGAWTEIPAGGTDNAIKVMLIGEVPYEAIESVNFDGDQFYSKPHLYCHFDFGGQPYERLFYGEEFCLDPGYPYHYREIADYNPKKLSRWKFLRRKSV